MAEDARFGGPRLVPGRLRHIIFPDA
ncbi:hypothetical protein BOSEA1005_40026 [Hyphomicrobiales bacterium]|nr:hypothetical protein BOSEA1005_40026 [Hyphomicrobiales bacterium]